MSLWIWSPLEPGPPDLIPGLLPRHGHLLISGETDVGKTTVALEIVQAVLTGLPLWGGGPTSSRVITQATYIMGEHHESILQSLWQLMSFGGQPALEIIPPSARRPLVSRGVLMERARDALKERCQGSQLVIFDPLNAFVAGSEVENDSVPMRACLNAMEDVAGSGALLVLAHMGKPAFDPKSGSYRHRESYASRGSSAIEDSVTCCFYLTPSRTADARGFKLIRRKYKGHAPAFYMLKRDPVTNRHTLVGGGQTDAQYRQMQREKGQLSRGAVADVTPK